MMEKTAESMLHVPFLFLIPFMLVSTKLSSGWHKNEIKLKNAQKPVIYQVYAPKKAEELKKMPMVIFIKDKGGKLTNQEVVKIQEQADLKQVVFLVPKSSKPEWTVDEVKNIEMAVDKMDKYRNVDDEQISVMSQNGANDVAVEFLCNTSTKIVKAQILNQEKDLSNTDCKNQELIELNNSNNISFWNEKSKAVQKLGAKSLLELLNI